MLSALYARSAAGPQSAALQADLRYVPCDLHSHVNATTTLLRNDSLDGSLTYSLDIALCVWEVGAFLMP